MRKQLAFASLLLTACLIHNSATVGATPPAKKTGTIRFSKIPGISAIRVESLFYGYQSAIDRDKTAGEAAYDYSVHLFYDRSAKIYRLFCGGRWRTPGRGDGDHVLQYTSKTGRAGTWKLIHNRPEFWQGGEEGKGGTWFTGNTLEPEILKVDGVYYMFTQVEIDPGQQLDQPGLKSITQADRIELHTSRDALTWTRFEKRGVVTRLDDPARTSLHHEEVIYAPWDHDGKPFWMYVGATIAGQWRGYYRLRSNDPKTFDWHSRERVNGFAQLGNQVAYIRKAAGAPLFVRITFTGSHGRALPTLEFSRDGLAWFWGDDGPVTLDGSKQEKHNRSCYFLGIATLDGTGELPQIAPNEYKTLYGATTCNSPVAPDIFRSEVGVGELTLRVITNDKKH